MVELFKYNSLYWSYLLEEANKMASCFRLFLIVLARSDCFPFYCNQEKKRENYTKREARTALFMFQVSENILPTAAQ
jgi:deoxyribodipyrimidine photolyase-like uncharacterized protein